MNVRIGIDLGTTNSAAAMVYDDGPHVIPRDGNNLDQVFIPSLVWLDWENGFDDVIVGAKAVQPGRSRIIRSIKRLMGRTYDKAIEEKANDHFKKPLSLERRLKNDLQLVIASDKGERRYWPQEISALILKEIVNQVEEKMKVVVDGAVITVPAYFGHSHRAATLEAARLAGIRVIEPLIDEPSAAALALSLKIQVPRAEPLLVVDWGGGTLDVTVLMNDGPTWIQLNIDGDLSLGGEDLDIALAKHVLARKRLPETLLEDNEGRFRLLDAARSTKEMLSTALSAPFACIIRDPELLRTTQVTDRLTREDFEAVAEPFISHVIELVQRCLDHPAVPVNRIRKVLLVGGSTFIPLLRRRLGALLPDARIHNEKDVNPMEAVALGAALYAEMNADNLRQICPQGYEVIGHNGVHREGIPPGQDIPTPEHHPYTIKAITAYGNQTVFKLTFVPYTMHPSGLKTLEPPFSAYGRDFPRRPLGSKVECELRLDANKVVLACFRLEGMEETQKADMISLWGLGFDADMSELKDCCLDVEALLEANIDIDGPLLQQLRTEWEKAMTLWDTRDSDEVGFVLNTLKELVMELETCISDPRAGSEEAAKDRVHGWVEFYERDMLPKYLHLLDEEERRVSFESIRRIRVMGQTGVPVAELIAELGEFDEQLQKMHIGPVLVAYRESAILGVPSRIKEELRELCDRAVQSYASGDHASFERRCEKLVPKKVEADERWRKWHANPAVVIVDSNLVVK
jgi:molecular chaperone DnaK (HSP70)